MKTVKLKPIFGALLLLISIPTLAAAAGGEGGGGGDLECDAQVRAIAGIDAKNTEGSLYFWYSHAGPQKDSQLDLSNTKDPNGKPYTKDELTKAMLNLMNKPLKSGCTHHQAGDPQAHPIMIGGVPKVCRTIVTDQYVDMLCDSDIFLTMKTENLGTADLQIQQINHEYAINVSGLEPDYASVPNQAPYVLDISTYTISQQLSAVTQTVQERKVMVMDPSHVVDLSNISSDPYLTLKAAFEAAGPASIGDYPLIKDLEPVKNAKTHCAAVSEGQMPPGETQDTLFPAMIGRFNYTVPGTSDDGPLFPGTPSKIVTTLSSALIITADGTQKTTDQQLVDLYNSRSLSMPVISYSSAGDLEASNISAQDASYSDLIVYRKSGNKLFWHDLSQEFNQAGTSQLDTYGYCY